MASFNYNNQNPSLLLFLMLLRAIGILTLQELQILNSEEKWKEFW